MSKTALAFVPTEGQIPSPVVPYVETNPVSVLLDESLRERFFAEIKKTITDFVPDLSTKASRAEIMRAAKMALIAIGAVEEPQAKAIVLAIAEGKIRNVSITF